MRKKVVYFTVIAGLVNTGFLFWRTIEDCSILSIGALIFSSLALICYGVNLISECKKHKQKLRHKNDQGQSCQRDTAR